MRIHCTPLPDIRLSLSGPMQSYTSHYHPQVGGKLYNPNKRDNSRIWVSPNTKMAQNNEDTYTYMSLNSYRITFHQAKHAITNHFSQNHHRINQEWFTERPHNLTSFALESSFELMYTIQSSPHFYIPRKNKKPPSFRSREKLFCIKPNERSFPNISFLFHYPSNQTNQKSKQC